MDLVPISDRIPVHQIAERIRNGSQSRFTWQTFVYDEPQTADINSAFVREIMASLAGDERCHGFLRDQLDGSGRDAFSIAPLTSSVAVRRAGDALALTLAAATTPAIGSDLRGADRPPRWDVHRTRKAFLQGGECEAYELMLDAKGEPRFTTWYSGAPRSWCYVVTWPRFNWIWIGCLADTN